MKQTSLICLCPTEKIPDYERRLEYKRILEVAEKLLSVDSCGIMV